ncbi:MAG: DUF5678 domain-containing protein [Actinomycetota bacterium]|nr:DUF5678 domain-containing protein [Actinomycetota bacterium]
MSIKHDTRGGGRRRMTLQAQARLYNKIAEDKLRYLGKWVAVKDGRVVAGGDTPDEALAAAKDKHPRTDPMRYVLDWVPEEARSSVLVV